jgi:hypothetical protein
VASSPHEVVRQDALAAFLEARLDEGYLVETRTTTQAIIVRPAKRTWTLARFGRQEPPDRQVIEVDSVGNVTASVAEPLRY